jgi:hypothetical protein
LEAGNWVWVVVGWRRAEVRVGGDMVGSAFRGYDVGGRLVASSDLDKRRIDFWGVDEKTKRRVGFFEICGEM